MKKVQCTQCGKKNLSKDELGLNKKFLPPYSHHKLCLTCLAAYLDTSEKELQEMVERFKEEGCTLFN